MWKLLRSAARSVAFVLHYAKCTFQSWFEIHYNKLTVIELKSHPALPQLITRCFPGSGADLWEVHQTAGYEWGVGYEDALPQLCAAEMWLLPERATGQTWKPNQEVKYYIYATVQKFGKIFFLFIKDALNWLKVTKTFMLQKTSVSNKCCF